MTSTELLALVRDEIADTATPYLVSDPTLYAYIDEAQKEFCRNTWGIADARSFKVKTVIGTEWYRFDPRIIRLLGATDDHGQPVPITTVEESDIKFDGRTGRTEALVKGLQKGFLRVYPVPDEAKTIDLRTHRISTDVSPGDDLEIDDQHHRSLTMWVKHKVYGKHDADLFDAGKSKAYFEEFRLYCEEAKRLQGRLHRHIAVVRMVF